MRESHFFFVLGKSHIRERHFSFGLSKSHIREWHFLFAFDFSHLLKVHNVGSTPRLQRNRRQAVNAIVIAP